jgi:ABC-2 type transport system permease protein
MSTHTDFSRLNPRVMGRCNWIGIITLIQKEVGRFLNVYMQTIVAPVITLMMFFTVFSLSFKQHIGGGGAEISGLLFLAPGLLMMTMVQNAFANPASSLIIAKVQGNIVDVLMPPLAAWEILTGLLVGALLRCLFIGILGYGMMRLVMPLHVLDIGRVVGFGILGNVMLASLGIIAGLWAEKFDHMATITNFVVTPLTFLSGTFYALSALPDFWQGMAKLNPFFYMIDGFRSGFIGFSETDHVIGFILIATIDILLIFTAWVMLRTGYKTKF